MPEARLERTRRAYQEPPNGVAISTTTWPPVPVLVVSPASCGECGGLHSDGSVCAPSGYGSGV